jgi:replication-associated recombination protein RarA
MEIVKRSLAENKIIVVDEFHRLGQEFFDFLHYTEKRGKIILISSTLNLSKNCWERNLP